MTLRTIPAGAAKRCFQLLDDFAVAAHGPVQTLEVAVDDEDEVVELSREASVREPIDSGSSISPSPRKAQTLRGVAGIMPRLSR